MGWLANHIWSFAGEDDRPDVNSTFLQPEANDWLVPVNFMVGKLVKFDKQPVSFIAGLRYWAAAPDSGPEGLGFRLW